MKTVVLPFVALTATSLEALASAPDCFHSIPELYIQGKFINMFKKATKPEEVGPIGCGAVAYATAGAPTLELSVEWSDWALTMITTEDSRP